ncbi:hypothetical protein Tco_0053131 [Tanacetum coccineum]
MMRYQETGDTEKGSSWSRKVSKVAGSQVSLNALTACERSHGGVAIDDCYGDMCRDQVCTVVLVRLLLELIIEGSEKPDTDTEKGSSWSRKVSKVGGARWFVLEVGSQVKDNKIDLLVQQYEQFTILEEESIDSSFARFNTIITSLKALDEGFSSKNCVRKFLRALHTRWRAKVMAIEESKDLQKGKKLNPLPKKLKKESSDDETSTSKSDDEEYAMAVRNFKKLFRRNGRFVRQQREEKKSFRQRDDKKSKSDMNFFRCGDLNHLIGECPKPQRNKDQKAFIGGSWSDSEDEADDKTNDETCLMAQSPNEVTLVFSHYSDNASSLDDNSLGFDSSKASTSGTKLISFVGSSAGNATNGSTIKVHGSTISGSVDPPSSEKW